MHKNLNVSSNSSVNEKSRISHGGTVYETHMLNMLNMHVIEKLVRKMK